LSAVTDRACASVGENTSRLHLAETRLRQLGVKEPELWAEVFMPAAPPAGLPSSAPVSGAARQKYGV
jgi:hypothetical protein